MSCSSSFGLDPGYRSSSLFHSMGHFFGGCDPLPYGYEFNGLERSGFSLLESLRTAIHFWTDPKASLPPLVLKVAAVALAMLTLPFTLLGSIFKAAGSLLPHTFSARSDKEIPATSKEVIDQLYEIHRIVHQTAKEANLPYILFSGSALGEARTQGIIPWDDDIDYAVKKEDLPLLNSLIPLLKNKGVVFEESLPVKLIRHYCIKLDPAMRRSLLGYEPKAYALCDIFILENGTTPSNEQGWIFAHPLIRQQFPNEWLKEEEFEIEERPFGPQSLLANCLKNPLSYLKRAYGEHCLDEATRTQFHLWIGSFPFLPFKIPPLIHKITPGYYAEGRKWRRLS